MKKLTFGILSIALLSLGACNNEVADYTQSVKYTTVNLITPLDGGESYATEGSYTFDLNHTQGNGTISTSSLKINNKDYTFTTDTVRMLNYTVQQGVLVRFQNVKGYLDRNTSMPLTDANFDITSLFYIPAIELPGYRQWQEYMPYIIAQYKAGDWYVATMQKDATFIGKTTTGYVDSNGTEQKYENSDMYYRLIIDIEKNKADLLIYKPKFASVAPELTGIRLKDLDVKYGYGSFSVEAENVVPGVAEGNDWTDNSKYVFNKLNITTTNKELTEISIDYTVAGAFKGSFKGSCVLALDAKN